VEAEVHMKSAEFRKATGGEIKYIIKTDKLFGVF